MWFLYSSSAAKGLKHVMRPLVDSSSHSFSWGSLLSMGVGFGTSGRLHGLRSRWPMAVSSVCGGNLRIIETVKPGSIIPDLTISMKPDIVGEPKQAW